MSASFRDAVEARDLDAAVACFAEDAVLHSPVTFKPFVGRAAIGGLLTLLLRTFEDFRYIGEFSSPDGASVLHFRTRVGDREVEGIDLIRLGADGRITDFTVMVRPLSAAIALRDSIGAQLGASPS